MKYQLIVGLEIHAELKTESKIFCACPVTFGAPPNTACCPICMGHPGTLPTLNRHAVELAVRAGLALGSRPAAHSRMDRKHYFYPDLPKGYQISQNEMPLCPGGALTFGVEGREVTVPLSRMHIEEDAGKLIHREGVTFIDHNRCGVPLLEVVTKPVMHTPEEASAFLKALRDALVTLGVSDCKMQEGGMRCDVNVSLSPYPGDPGVRTEIKNINSFAFVEKAIRYEAERQRRLLEAGEQVVTQTLRYDESTGTTIPMRQKEKSEDYCYLPEPNLPAFYLTGEELEALGRDLPLLPYERAKELEERYGLSCSDASILSAQPSLADFYEAAAHNAPPRIVSNLLISHLLPLCAEPFASPVAPHRLSRLASLCGEGRINNATAKSLLLRLVDGDFCPDEVILKEDLEQITDRGILWDAITRAMAADVPAVTDYKSGKKAAINRLLGAAIRRTQGKADPNLLRSLLAQALEQF